MSCKWKGLGQRRLNVVDKEINEAQKQKISDSYLRTGLETANGVATPPMALILCCIVGVADDVVRLPVPIRGTVDCCICCCTDIV